MTIPFHHILTHVQGRGTVKKKSPGTESSKKRSPSQFVEFTKYVLDDKWRKRNKDSSSNISG
jgi:hypothetical protein